MAIPKLLVANELLDQALRLCYEGESYFAALHLAGAAQEIFGKTLTSLRLESALENHVKVSFRSDKHLGSDGGQVTSEKEVRDEVLFAKNATKHLDIGRESSVDFDAQIEAYDLLDHAVSDFNQLADLKLVEETARIRRFNEDVARRGDVP